MMLRREIVVGVALVLAIGTMATAGFVEALTSTPGLVSYWDLNEPSGTAAADSVTGDAVDGNNPGAYSGAGVTVGQAGPNFSDGFAGFAGSNRAPKFDGTTTQLLSMLPAGYAGLTDLTLTAWFRYDSTSGAEHIGGLEDTSGSRYVFATHDYGGGPSFFTKRTDGSQISIGAGAVPNRSDWHFLAMTYEGGTTNRVYLDGVLKSTGTNANPLGLQAADTLVFARDAGATSRNLEGQLDEIAVFNRALSPAEVQGLYHSAITYVQAVVDSPGVTNYWRFEETSGSTATDFIAGNVGTYTTVTGSPIILGQPGGRPADGLYGLGPRNKAAQFVYPAGRGVLEMDSAGPMLGAATMGDAFSGGIDEMTMALWWKPVYSGAGWIAGFTSGEATRYHFILRKDNSTDLKLYVKADNGQQIIVGSIPFGEYDWHHLAMTWDGSAKSVRLYIDGVETVNTTNAAMSQFLRTPEWFYIGRDHGGNTLNLGGLVDELSLWNRALSADELRRLYAAGVAPEPCSLALLGLGALGLLRRRRRNRAR